MTYPGSYAHASLRLCKVCDVLNINCAHLWWCFSTDGIDTGARKRLTLNIWGEHNLHTAVPARFNKKLLLWRVPTFLLLYFLLHLL